MAETKIERRKTDKPKKHIHKYQKGKLSASTGTVIYKCVLPGCSHYILPTLLKHRESICHRCDKPFIILREHERMAKPHCSNCIKRKGERLPDIDVLDLLLEGADYE